MDSGIIAIASAILTVIGTTIAVNNYLHSRFSLLTKDVEGLLREHSVSKTQIAEKLEHQEYLNNANRELIEHRTQRFLKDIEKLEGQLQKMETVLKVEMRQYNAQTAQKIEALQTKLSEMEGYLASNSEFIPRKRGDRG